MRCGHLSVGEAAFVDTFGVDEDRMDQRGPASRDEGNDVGQRLLIDMRQCL